MYRQDKLRAHEYVSFDIFDTLIKRSVARPEDLFLLMEQCENMDVPVGFAQKRQEAAIRARERANGFAGLHQIYEELRSEFGKATQMLMDLEIQMEFDGCQPNPQCVEQFKYCVESGKTVILISDMYLPATIISRMLEKCDILGYKRLYISCEAKSKKRDGSLFKKVLADLRISPQQLLHIGDNRRSDFLIPRVLGIHTLWIENDQKVLCKRPRSISLESELTHRTIQACIRNCSYTMAGVEKQGCRFFGPLLYGYVRWLADQFNKDGIFDVYFLARDGYMLKQAFDVLNIKNIRTNYLYCSRRSYQVPLIWKHSKFDEVIQNFSQVNKMTVRNFLMRVGMEPEIYAEKVREYGLDMDFSYEKGTFYKSERVETFYNNVIREDAERNAKEEYDALSNYIHSLKMADRIAVVDIGYYGTIQRALVELLEEEGLNTSVRGYYLGLDPNSQFVRDGRITATGYLYDLDTGANRMKTLSTGVYLFEAQFLAPSGSVKRFVCRNGESRPEFDTFLYENNAGQKIDELKLITEYQSGAIKFIHYMQKAYPLNCFSVRPDVAIYEFGRFVLSPALYETRQWGDLRYVSYVWHYLAYPRTIRYYLLHPKTFKEDYLVCGWKIGFLRRLLKIPFPYDKMLRIARQIYHRT